MHPGSTPPRPDGAPRRPDAAPPRPDGGRPAPLARDRTLFVLIAIGLVSVLVAAAILVAAPDPTPSALPTPSPSPPTTSEGAYAFLATTFRDGVRVPVRWNPCQPIEYQIHLIDAPQGARTAIEGAIAGTSQATGLAFVSDGDTGRTASQLEDRFFYADALHAVYRPVLITVVSHRTFRSLGAPARAVAFAHPEQGHQALDDQFVAGVVVVDGDVPYAHAGRWSLATRRRARAGAPRRPRTRARPRGADVQLRGRAAHDPGSDRGLGPRRPPGPRAAGGRPGLPRAGPRRGLSRARTLAAGSMTGPWAATSTTSPHRSRTSTPNHMSGRRTRSSPATSWPGTAASAATTCGS